MYIKQFIEQKNQTNYLFIFSSIHSSHPINMMTSPLLFNEFIHLI